jgi:ubiquinone/menaquinone biosynthesis C-methylase UbiE
MSKDVADTRSFYDQFWPQHIPNYSKTKEHVLRLLPEGRHGVALDGGCGTGVCSAALSAVAQRVVSLDISEDSLRVGEKIIQELSLDNVNFVEGSLVAIPFFDGTFDLVFSWGAIHHTSHPVQALDELCRVLKTKGVLILAVYLKTHLTWLHEVVRKMCLCAKGFPGFKRIFIKTIVGCITLHDKVYALDIARDDVSVESLVEDWFFVPEKHFFTIDQMRGLFEQRNLDFELLHKKIGRFKSSTNFIVRGTKR